MGGFDVTGWQVSDGGQTLAALGTAAVQDGTAVLGCHAGTETVRTGAVQVARLECAFGRHDTEPCVVSSGNPVLRVNPVTGPRMLAMRGWAVKD